MPRGRRRTRTDEELAAAREKKAVELEEFKKLYVSDHALWRFAERFMGFPRMEKAREECRAYINDLGTLEQLERAGFKVLGRTIVTFVPKKARQK